MPKAEESDMPEGSGGSTDLHTDLLAVLAHRLVNIAGAATGWLEVELRGSDAEVASCPRTTRQLERLQDALVLLAHGDAAGALAALDAHRPDPHANAPVIRSAVRAARTPARLRSTAA